MDDTVTLVAWQRTMLAVVLIGYVIGLLVLSIYATRKVKDEEDYLVAGRRLPLFLAWGTLMATWFGAASMIGACQAARDEGILGTILDPFACGFTLILAGIFFAKPLWSMKLLTMGDFYRQKYGTKAEILGTCIQVPGYFGWIAAQYIALASVQHAYFGIRMEYGILIAASITLVYTLIGGMWSVTLTDTLQLVIALSGLIVLGCVTYSQLGDGSIVGGISRIVNEVDPKKLSFFPTAGAAAVLVYLGNWASGLFGNIPGQDLQQRVFAANGPNTARWACILAGVLYLTFGMIPVSIGLGSTLTHTQDIEGKILMMMAGEFLHPVIMVIFVVSVVSIVVSTATSAVLAPATMLGHNLLGRLRVFDGHHLFMERLSVFVVSVGGVALCFYSDEIIPLLEVSLSIALVALFVPMVMGMYGKPKGQLPALLAMSFGVVTWLAHRIFEESIAPMPEIAEMPQAIGLSLEQIAAQVGMSVADLKDKGLEYHVYLREFAYPADRVGAFGSRLAGAVGFVPADLLGFAVSWIGYFTGQLLSRKPIEESDEQLAAAE